MLDAGALRLASVLRTSYEAPLEGTNEHWRRIGGGEHRRNSAEQCKLSTMQAGRACKLATLAVLIAAAVVAALIVGDYGLSWDEPSSSRYGLASLRYYTSFGSDSAALADLAAARGAVFHIAAGAAESLVPLNPVVARHLVTLAVAFAGLLAVWGLARRLGGTAAALLAPLFLLTTNYAGHAFINPSDLPFAAGYIASLYFIARVLDGRAPNTTVPHVLLGFIFGLTLSTRLSGAFLLLIFSAASVVEQRRRCPEISLPRSVARCAPNIILTAVVAGLTLMLTWPSFLSDPIATLSAAANSEAAFGKTEDVLFGGRLYPASALPRSYWFVYVFAVLPEVVIVGLTLAFASVRGKPQDLGGTTNHSTLSIVLVASVGVPLLAATVLRPTDYDGMRHFLFLTPPICVLAAVGIVSMWRRIRGIHRIWRAVFAAGLAVGLLIALGRQVRTHPYQYASYNTFVGGFEGASDDYVTDYWGTSFAHLIPKVVKALPPGSLGKSNIKVLVCGPSKLAEHYLPTGYELVTTPDLADLYLGLRKSGCTDFFSDRPLVAREALLGVELAVARDLRDKIPTRQATPLP